MKVQKLLQQWQRQSEQHELLHEYHLRLPRHELAKVRALGEMFPGIQVEQLLADLLVTALHDLEAAMPYVQGDQIVAEDESGDPIFEDVGPTPRFLALTRKHVNALAEG